MVRHTPPFCSPLRYRNGHRQFLLPSPRGDGYAVHCMPNNSLYNDTSRPQPRHPLSERGEGTACGRSDSEAVNKRAGCVAQPSKKGVSHSPARCKLLSATYFKFIISKLRRVVICFLLPFRLPCVFFRPVFQLFSCLFRLSFRRRCALFQPSWLPSARLWTH